MLADIWSSEVLQTFTAMAPSPRHLRCLGAIAVKVCLDRMIFWEGAALNNIDRTIPVDLTSETCIPGLHSESVDRVGHSICADGTVRHPYPSELTGRGGYLEHLRYVASKRVPHEV